MPPTTSPPSSICREHYPAGGSPQCAEVPRLAGNAEAAEGEDSAAEGCEGRIPPNSLPKQHHLRIRLRTRRHIREFAITIAASRARSVPAIHQNPHDPTAAMRDPLQSGRSRSSSSPTPVMMIRHGFSKRVTNPDRAASRAHTSTPHRAGPAPRRRENPQPHIADIPPAARPAPRESGCCDRPIHARSPGARRPSGSSRSPGSSPRLYPITIGCRPAVNAPSTSSINCATTCSRRESEERQSIGAFHHQHVRLTQFRRRNNIASAESEISGV